MVIIDIKRQKLFSDNIIVTLASEGEDNEEETMTIKLSYADAGLISSVHDEIASEKAREGIRARREAVKTLNSSTDGKEN